MEKGLSGPSNSSGAYFIRMYRIPVSPVLQLDDMPELYSTIKYLRIVLRKEA